MVASAPAPVAAPAASVASVAAAAAVAEAPPAAEPTPEPVPQPEPEPVVPTPEPVSQPVEPEIPQPTQPVAESPNVVAAPPVEVPPAPEPVEQPPVAPAPPEPEVAPAEPVMEVPEPPAIPKTQPIQIKSKSDLLPPERADVPELTEEIPRLDVSLADSPVEPTLLQDPERAPTTIHLPQPGDDELVVESPDDFTEQTVYQPSPEPLVEPQAPPAYAPEVAEELVIPAAEQEPPPIAFEEPAVAPLPEEPVVPMEQPVIEQPVPEAPQEQPVVEQPISEEPEHVPLIEQPALQEPEENLPTSEGSIANMLAPPEPEDAAPQEALTPAPESEPETELDVLDELLAEPTGEKPKKTLTVLLVSIVLMAVLATVAMIFAVNALGGFAMPDNSSEDKAKEAEQNYSIVPSTESVNPDLTVVEDNSNPDINDAPAQIDPPALPADQKPGGSSVTLPGDDNPVKISDGPAAEAPSPPQAQGLLDATPPAQGSAAEAIEQFNKQFEQGAEETVESLGNGLTSLTNEFTDQLNSTVDGTAQALNSIVPGSPGYVEPDAAAPALTAPEVPAGSPDEPIAAPDPTEFPAPGPGDNSLGLSREIAEAFLNASSWEAQLPLVYQGDSLRPAITEYYQKHQYNKPERFSLNWYQTESSTDQGGPYWVYLVSTSGIDQGFPLIVRQENNLLKVDWEVYSEFAYRHFGDFRSGTDPGPQTFRVILERKSEYYGTDRPGFTDRESYLVYEISMPYGGRGEYNEYAFVKRGTSLATQIDQVLGLGDEQLAAIVTLERQPFPHGVKHYVITKWINEGWFK